MICQTARWPVKVATKTPLDDELANKCVLGKSSDNESAGERVADKPLDAKVKSESAIDVPLDNEMTGKSVVDVPPDHVKAEPLVDQNLRQRRCSCTFRFHFEFIPITAVSCNLSISFQ